MKLYKSASVYKKMKMTEHEKTQSPFEKSMDNEMQRTQIKLDRILSIIGGLSEAMVERVEEAKKLVKEL